MKNTLNTLLIGGSGIASSEILPVAVQAAPTDIPNIVSVIVQILIGVATLLGLFKNNKSLNN